MREIGVGIRVYPALRDEPETDAPAATLVLAHGAGAGQLHPFMVSYARGVASGGIDVVTFDFTYMLQKRRLPDPAPALEARYRDVIEATLREVPSASRALFIGGKSMGGRMATHVAAADASLRLAGLVLLGYPMHPPGRPAQRRDAHLHQIHRPVLFVQGTRDSFGSPDELRPALDAMSPSPTLHGVEGGDHSFKVPRARAGSESPATTQRDVDAAIQQVIINWMRRHC